MVEKFAGNGTKLIGFYLIALFGGFVGCSSGDRSFTKTKSEAPASAKSSPVISLSNLPMSRSNWEKTPNLLITNSHHLLEGADAALFSDSERFVAVRGLKVGFVYDLQKGGQQVADLREPGLEGTGTFQFLPRSEDLFIVVKTASPQQHMTKVMILNPVANEKAYEDVTVVAKGQGQPFDIRLGPVFDYGKLGSIHLYLYQGVEAGEVKHYAFQRVKNSTFKVVTKTKPMNKPYAPWGNKSAPVFISPKFYLQEIAAVAGKGSRIAEGRFTTNSRKIAAVIEDPFYIKDLEISSDEKYYMLTKASRDQNYTEVQVRRVSDHRVVASQVVQGPPLPIECRIIPLSDKAIFQVADKVFLFDLLTKERTELPDLRGAKLIDNPRNENLQVVDSSSNLRVYSLKARKFIGRSLPLSALLSLETSVTGLASSPRGTYSIVSLSDPSSMTLVSRSTLLVNTAWLLQP